VSSGSDALLVALVAAGVRPGDEVVTTPLTFIATAESIVRAGAVPRFVDVEPESLLIDVERVEAAVGARTRAVVPVHLYGALADVESLRGLARRRSVLLVEDCAQAFGSPGAGRGAAAGCFSFFPTKVLGAAGDGGLVATRSEDLARTCRRLRQHGRDDAGNHVAIGGNYRLDALQAAVLSVKLQHVERRIAARRANALTYDRELSALDGISAVGASARGAYNGAVYTIRVNGGRRDELRRFLAARDIETAVYYPRPLHLEPVFALPGVPQSALPVAERAAEEVLSLPIHASLTNAQLDRVVDALRVFCR
jgi:dTDP-4-amino-4,6-dideoxygalactose transaminase